MTLIDARPAGLDAFFRPDNGVAVTLAWPEGSLLDRTFVAYIGDVALDVDVDQTGTTMTLSCDAEDVSSVTRPAPFVLSEVLSGIYIDTLIGTWAPSDNPAAVSHSSSQTVTVDSHTVEVEVLASPASMPVGILDEAVLTSASSNLSVSAFSGALVPNTIVTVPDVPYPVLLRGHGAMIHSVANSVCALVIVEAGGSITQRLDVGYGYNGTTASNPATAYPEALLDPHSPGEYQLMVYSFQTGTIRVEASQLQHAWLRVLAS